jgi:hypothetical protein
MPYSADMGDYTLLGLTKPFPAPSDIRSSKNADASAPAFLKNSNLKSQTGLLQSRNRSSRMMIGIGMPIIQSKSPRTMVFSSSSRTEKQRGWC